MMDQVNKQGMVLPQDVYALQLATINGINFTRREIDVIACTLSGKISKKIALLLSISPKTVENHMRNIILKIGCNNQTGIIDFVEKTNKFSLVKNHYSNLLVQHTFESELKKILKVASKRNLSGLIIYIKEQQKDKMQFFNHFTSNLQAAGINIFIEHPEKNALYFCLENKIKLHHVNHIICHLDAALADDEVQLIQLINKNPYAFVFISTDGDASVTIPKELSNAEYVSLQEQENYYFFVFEVLKKLLAPLSLDEYLSVFKQKYRDFSENPIRFNSEQHPIFESNHQKKTHPSIFSINLEPKNV